jgi:hypothetical protein
MTTTHVPQCTGDRVEQRQRDSNPISETILFQLGGAQFISTTGAKIFVGLANGLQFKIPAAKDGINAVVILLNARDYYDVEYYKIRGAKVKLVRSDTDVPADMLASSFELATGLYTKLF